MANAITIGDARRHYQKHTPLHGRTRQHKADLHAISKSSTPMTKADSLITKRRDEVIDRKIDEMLTRLQGRRTRHRYDQSAVIALEHLTEEPFDPHTQLPIWRDMLRRSKGTTLPKAEFYRDARSIFQQFSMFNPAAQ
ncbi:hypothetical protein LCM27_06605 [Ruegeria marisrubri]|uniref:hypothetical protein n=1 Tax=Ruegeria marisrubri TaxID=1685379 RepID=UPI001CD310D9|nr:hypothetical protein [Ruegeria marisrubri]MCA0906065.1 hypothetical protein [Ruegeria marisrubri]